MEETDYVPLKAAQFDKSKSQSRLAKVPNNASLAYRCCAVVVTHLEQYSPQSFGILSEHDWDTIVRMRHERTAPIKGQRRVPAISERFLVRVEEENPQLADSDTAATLVWKDIVEVKFPTTGPARSVAFLYPWPVLVQRMKRAGSDLLELYDTDQINQKDVQYLERAIRVLSGTPINVSLLQETGIGKTLKKFIKISTSKYKEKAVELGVFTERTVHPNKLPISPMSQVEDLINQWKEVAAKSGVAMNLSTARDKDHKSSGDGDIQADLKLIQSCKTWRDLYHLLQKRESERRANQGARMRESRERLARTQPKIVKVRPAKAKHDAILNRPFGPKHTSAASSTTTSSSHIQPQNKLQALRAEAKVAAAWQKSKPDAKNGSSFGSAVAFCGVGKSAKRLVNHGATQRTALALSGGKVLKPPSKIPAATLKKKLAKSVRR